MKIAKKLVTYFCLIFLLASTLTSQAAENGDIIDGSILTNLSEVSGTTQSKGRGTYLAYEVPSLQIKVTMFFMYGEARPAIKQVIR